RKADSDTEDDKAKASPPPSKAIATSCHSNDPMPVRDAEEAELVSELRNLAQSVSSSRSIERRQLRLTYYPAYLPSKMAGRLFRLLERQVTYYGPDIAKVFVFGKWHPMPRQLCAYGDAGVARHQSTGQALAAQPRRHSRRPRRRRQTWPRPLQLRPG
ncbi:hypothetical protein BOX15_Mlig011029g1, partial [Macrostomum lignano]